MKWLVWVRNPQHKLFRPVLERLWLLLPPPPFPPLHLCLNGGWLPSPASLSVAPAVHALGSLWPHTTRMEDAFENVSICKPFPALHC